MKCVRLGDTLEKQRPEESLQGASLTADYVNFLESRQV